MRLLPGLISGRPGPTYPSMPPGRFRGPFHFGAQRREGSYD
jgi:hypothetical protein